jgi:hypothetical protein
MAAGLRFAASRLAAGLAAYLLGALSIWWLGTGFWSVLLAAVTAGSTFAGIVRRADDREARRAQA